MEKEQQIKELQEKINSLARNINSFQDELFSLHDQLNALRGDSTPVASPQRKIFRGRQTFYRDDDDKGLENYIGLKFMHITGIVVLVIGLSIGVKYAIDKKLISEVARILLAYVAGGALFILSWRLKKKYLFFSAILFSGSMASIYFTTYAAFVYYNFFPFYIAFAIMVALTVYTTIAAISYNREEIAILGMIGAYGIPFLISSNSERVDLFFSYILLINMGVVFISFRRNWKGMQYLALLITWTLFITWGFVKFSPKDELTGIIFLASFYVLFLISAIAGRISRGGTLSPAQIQQVLVNNIALYIGAILIFGVNEFETNLAGVSGTISVFFGLIALSFVMLWPDEILLQRMLAWQSIVLLIIFIGSQWDGLTVTLLWIAVAVLLFVWGILNKRSWPRLASIMLMGITLVKLIIFDSVRFNTVQKIISFLVIGVLLLLFSFYYQKFNLTNSKTEVEK